MNRQPRLGDFRSVTVNMGSRKMRTLIITMCLSVAVMLVLVSILAAQLMAANGKNTFAGNVLHSVSNQTLTSIVSQEIPMYASADPQAIGEVKEHRSNLTTLLFYLFTDIDIEHPESLLNRQISAMAVSNFKPLIEGYEESPSIDKLPEQVQPEPEPAPEVPEPPVVTDGKPWVYIYHTHNRESYLPDLEGVTDFNKSYDKTKNITLVGDRLIKSLKARNIPAIQTKNDYWFKGNEPNEYNLSRKTVEEILKKHDGIKMVFDIHRDSFPRNKTTAKVKGQDVAQIFFIIGGSNPQKSKNIEFAKRLHSKLEQLYPGISKGVHENQWANPNIDSRYNQDLHPQSVIVEIGGPENTLEETYRTADILAHVIEELVKEERKSSNKQ